MPNITRYDGNRNTLRFQTDPAWLFSDETEVGLFGVENFVEEKGIVPLSKPGTTVVKVPECDTIYLVAVLLENLKDTLILLVGKPSDEEMLKYAAISFAANNPSDVVTGTTKTYCPRSSGSGGRGGRSGGGGGFRGGGGGGHRF